MLPSCSSTASCTECHAMGKGGARHFAKPQVDPGILLQILLPLTSLLQNLGPYEGISKSQSVSPKGLVHCLPLSKGLIDLAPTGEDTRQLSQRSFVSATDAISGMQ